MTSPLSGATLTAQRAVNRSKKYYCAISHPNSVFTARINQTFTSFDGVTELTWDGGTGTYGDVKPGMSCYIGSAAGLFDIGIVRVRKALTSNKAPIGKCSGLQLANNQYLTFVDDFQIWACEPLVTDTNTLIDTDVAWTAAGAAAPIVKIGPTALVISTTAASAQIHWTAPTIYSPTGATAASYVWTAPGASATADLTTSTPLLTYNATGEYYVRCTVTDSAGASTSVTRKVFYNPTAPVVSVSDLAGDVDSGGWSCNVEGYSGVDISALHDRTMVVLWKKDFVGSAADTSYGPYTNAENIRMIGWIDGHSLSINPDYGTASFTVYGPAYWMDKIPGFPMTITDATATTWNTMTPLYTDKALFRLVRWHSTLSQITDITLTGDTTRQKFCNINTGSLRQQIDSLAGEKLLASIKFNRFGCGQVYTPQSLLDSTGKSALEILWDSTSSDWIEQVDITRVTSGNSSMMEIGGTGYDGTTEAGYYSRAPGNSAAHYGTIDAPYSALALNSQAVANRLSGDILAHANAEYPTVDLVLYWPNDFIDIVPPYIVRLTVAAADTPLGVSFTTKRFYAEAVSYELDPETGAESTLPTLREETTGNNGVTYHPPEVTEPGYPEVPPVPEWPIWPPPEIWVPPVVPPPPPGGGCDDDSPANSFGLIFTPTTLADTESATAYFPCRLRASTATNKSYIYIKINYENPANFIDCYAIAGGARVATGSVTKPTYAHEDTAVTFYNLVAELDVSGFEVVAHCGAMPTPGTIEFVSADFDVSPGDPGTVFNVAEAEQYGDSMVRVAFDYDTVDGSEFVDKRVDISVLVTKASIENMDIYVNLFWNGDVGQLVKVYTPSGGTLVIDENSIAVYSGTLFGYTSTGSAGSVTVALATFATQPVSYQGTAHGSGQLLIISGSGTLTASHVYILSARVYNVCASEAT